MKFLKGFGKFLLVILSIILSLIFTATLVLFNVREISSNYLNEDFIKEAINSIDYGEIIKESVDIDEIKKELSKEGIDTSFVDQVFESEIINDGIDTVVNESIDYLVFGKEFDKSIYSSENIYGYVNDNIDTVINEVNKNAGKEVITNKDKKEILKVVEENCDYVSEAIDESVTELEETLYDTDQYKEIEEMQKQVDNVIQILDKFYSIQVTIIIIVVMAVIYLLIAATRRSFVKSILWIAIPFVFVGLVFLAGYVSFDVFVSIVDFSEVPSYFMGTIDFVINSVRGNFLSVAIWDIIIGIVLIAIRIGIKIYNNKKNAQV